MIARADPLRKLFRRAAGIARVQQLEQRRPIEAAAPEVVLEIDQCIKLCLGERHFDAAVDVELDLTNAGAEPLAGLKGRAYIAALHAERLAVADGPDADSILVRGQAKLFEAFDLPDAGFRCFHEEMRKIRIVVKRDENGNYTLKKYANRMLVASRKGDMLSEPKRAGELTAGQYDACLAVMKASNADTLEMRFIEMS